MCLGAVEQEQERGEGVVEIVRSWRWYVVLCFVMLWVKSMLWVMCLMYHVMGDMCWVVVCHGCCYIP